MKTVRKKLYPGETFTVPLNVNRIKVSIYAGLNKNIASGLNDASLFTTSGYTYSWGLNDNGQLGLNDTTSRSTPVYILTNNPDAYFIAAGGKHTVFAGYGSFTRAAVGKNINGQLGDGSVVSKSTPTVIALQANSVPIMTIAATENSSFLVSWNGIYQGCGLNEHGVLGLNDTTPRSSAVLVPAWSTSLGVHYGFSGGKNHLIGWGVNGGFASGLNTHGQLGNGSVASKSTPTAISGGLKWQIIAAGGDHSLGLTQDGKLYSWGRNNVGQLGLNTLATAAVSSPVLVSAPVGVKFQDIGIGVDHSYAIARDGRLFSWGGNAHGQLGLGDTIDRSSPALVATATKFVQLNGSCGNYRSMAISQSGNVFMWGKGEHGALGNNSVNSLSTPAMVIGDSGNASIAVDSMVVESIVMDVSPGAQMTLENDNGYYLSFGGKKLIKSFFLSNKLSNKHFLVLEY